jgi:hypothetical protein
MTSHLRTFREPLVVFLFQTRNFLRFLWNAKWPDEVMFEKGEMDWVLSPLNHLVLEKNDLRPIALFSMHANVASSWSPSSLHSHWVNVRGIFTG